MFKKLFPIKYNNKTFMIFVDSNHYKVFLEEKNNKLYYPNLEDYRYLDKLYNELPDVLLNIKRYSFTPKVVYKKQLVSLVMAVSMGLLPSCKYKDVNAEEILNNNQTIYEEVVQSNDEVVDNEVLSNKNLSYEEQLKALDDYFNNEKVSREDVISVINSNDNLSMHDKKICLTVLDDLLSVDPNMNLRMFYENLKTLKILRVTELEIKHDIGENAQGYYQPNKNEIKVIKGKVSDFTLAHEIIHASHSFCREYDGKIYYVVEANHSFIAEAYTNKIASISFGVPDSYSIQGLLLDYLLYYVPSMTYAKYNEYGVSAIITEVKNNFPDIDIDYILDYYQVYTISSAKFNKDNNLNFKDVNLLNELFKFCLTKIDSKNIRKSFDRFSFLVSSDKKVLDIYTPWYVKYLQDYLKNENVLSEADYNLVNNLNSVVICNGNIYFLNSDNTYLDYNRNIQNIDDNAIIVPVNKDFNLSILELITKSDNWYNNESLTILLKANYNDLPFINYIARISKGNTDESVKAMFNDNNDFYWAYKNIIKLCSKYNPNLYERYCQIIIDNNILSKEQIDKINQLKFFTIVGDNLYLAHDNTSYYDESGNVIKSENELLLIPLDNNFKEDLIEELATGKGISQDDLLLNNLLGNDELKEYLKSLPLDKQEIVSDKILDAIVHGNQNKLINEKEECLSFIKEAFNCQIDPMKYDLTLRFLTNIQGNELGLEDVINVSNARKLVIVDNNIYLSFDMDTYMDYEDNVLPLNDNYLSLPFDYLQKEQLLSRIVYFGYRLNSMENLNGFITYYINDDMALFLHTLSFEDQKTVVNLIITNLLTDVTSAEEYQILTDRLKMMIYLKCGDLPVAEYFKDVGLILDTNPPTFESEVKTQMY